MLELERTVTITGGVVGDNDLQVLHAPLKEKIVTITVTNIEDGTDIIRIIGSENYKDLGCPPKMKTTLYKVILSDNFGGKNIEYAVSRDAPVIDKSNPTKINTHWFKKDDVFFRKINTAFEPLENKIKLKAVRLEYPPGSGLSAVAMRNINGGIDIPAHPVSNPYEPRKNKNFASSVMIHVGGEYLHADGRTMSTVGSFGCSGLFKPMSGNKGIINFINELKKRALTDSMLRIIYEKRKNVSWNFEIDTDANLI